MRNTERFDGKSRIYDKARPQYAPALFDFFKTVLNIPEGGVFADIGSGTGIFSTQLLDRGYRVLAVEPNDGMRRRAEEKLLGRKGFISAAGTDCATTLPDRSVDCVAAAQAFHWFSPGGFRRECARILRPGGQAVLVYNLRDRSASSMQALAEVHRRFCRDFRGFSGGVSGEACVDFFRGTCRTFQAENNQLCTRQQFIGRALSSSYSLREGDPEYPAYLQALGRVFDDFSSGGQLTVPIRTVAWAGLIPPASSGGGQC